MKIIKNRQEKELKSPQLTFKGCDSFVHCKCKKNEGINPDLARTIHQIYEKKTIN